MNNKSHGLGCEHRWRGNIWHALGMFGSQFPLCNVSCLLVKPVTGAKATIGAVTCEKCKLLLLSSQNLALERRVKLLEELAETRAESAQSAKPKKEGGK